MKKTWVGTEPIFCDNCGKEYQYDPFHGYGCLVLIDDRQVPRIILGAWCNEACLNIWQAKDLLGPEETNDGKVPNL